MRKLRPLQAISILLVALVSAFLDTHFGRSDTFMCYAVIDPVTLSAIVVGGSGLLNGLLGAKSTSDANATNLKIARENNLFNAEQAEINRQWQEYAYKKYQSPIAQVQQLREAGLNPALVYGEGSTGSFSGSAASASPSTPVQPVNLGLDTAVRSAVDMYQQGKYLEQNTRKTSAEASGVEIDNRYKDQQLMYQTLEKMQNVRKGSVEYKMLEQEYRRAERMMSIRDAREQAELDLAKVRYNQIQEEIAASQLAGKLAISADTREWQRLSADIKQINAMIENLASSTSLNKANVGRVAQDIKDMIERTRGVKLTNDKMEQIQNLVIEEVKGNHEVWKWHNKYEVARGHLLPVEDFWNRLSSIIPFAPGSRVSNTYNVDYRNSYIER